MSQNVIKIQDLNALSDCRLKVKQAPLRYLVAGAQRGLKAGEEPGQRLHGPATGSQAGRLSKCHESEGKSP